MSTKSQIDALWDDFRDSINSAYRVADESRNEDGICLRGYAENISWSDSLRRLLERETVNERQHRSNRPSVPGFSAETAAKLILMGQAANGAKMTEMPHATSFLVFRQTAVEAQVIGFLAQAYLSEAWHALLGKLDYSKLMQPEKVA